MTIDQLENKTLNCPNCGVASAIGRTELLEAYHRGRMDLAAELQFRGIHLDVLLMAYDWTYDVDGEIHGLTAGDHGYEPTGIKVSDVAKVDRQEQALRKMLHYILKRVRLSDLSDHELQMFQEAYSMSRNE